VAGHGASSVGHLAHVRAAELESLVHLVRLATLAMLVLGKELLLQLLLAPVVGWAQRVRSGRVARSARVLSVLIWGFLPT